MPPFDAAMAKRHKLGLSPKQVRQWVAVAQSMYDRCMADGGSAGPCEATAIRGANGVTGEPRGNLRHLTVHVALTAPPQHMTLNNLDYLTAPCVMLVAGVLNGGLIGEAELVPQDWNACPVTIGHPTDATTGNAISARAPHVLASRGVGHVYHVRLGQGTRGTEQVASLVGDLWLDVARMQALGGEAQQALTMLEAEEPLEVSTGFFSYAVAGQGSYLGTPYSEQHFDLRPDHLALLPNAIGACNWADGCGSPRLHEACACGGTCPTCQETMPMDDPSPTRLQALWTMLARFFHEPLMTHILSAARRPTFSGTESTAWSAPTVAEAIKAFGGDAATQAMNVADLPATMKRRVAAVSLLGDPAADNARDLLMFPVVNVHTRKLNEGALRAVISGRGSQANIPAAAKTSAQNMARRLLNSEFDAGLETNQAQCPACGSFLPDADAGEDITCPRCGAVTTMADVRHGDDLHTQQTDGDLRAALYGALAREQGDDVYSTPFMIQDLDVPNQTFRYRMGERLMQRRWSTNDTGEVVLAGDPQDVQSDTRYIPVTQQEVSMPTDSVKRRVDALIANERTGWKETDRAHLEQMDEFMLLRLEQQPQTAPTRKAQTAEELITEMYAEPSVQQTVRAMYKDYQTRKTRAIEVLLALPKRPQSLTEERMQAMEADDLEEYILMAGADVPLRPGVPGTRDYSGRGGPARREVPEDEQVPPIPKTFALVVEQQRKLGLIQ